jgi:hypothetical protein
VFIVVWEQRTSLKPIDALDACCEKHDRCFNGVHFSCNMINCNLALSRCASALADKCSLLDMYNSLKTGSMCAATTNIKVYGAVEAAPALLTCSNPYANLRYKTDEDLERESCNKTKITTKLDGNGISYCKQPSTKPTPSATPTPRISAALGSGGTFRVSTGSVAMTHDAKGCSNKVWMNTIAGGTDQRWALTATRLGSETAYYVRTAGCSGDLYLTAGNCDLIVDDSDSSVPDGPDNADDANVEEDVEDDYADDANMDEDVEDARSVVPAPKPIVPAPRPTVPAPLQPVRDYDDEDEVDDDYAAEDYDDSCRRHLAASIPGCSTVSLTPGRNGATSQMWLLEGSGSKFTLRSLQLKQGRYDASYLSAAAVRGAKPDIVPRSGTVFTLTK